MDSFTLFTNDNNKWKMEDIDNEQLISLVMCRPILWDKTLDIYTDKIGTRNAWHEVCSELKPNFVQMEDVEKNEFGREIMKRWANLRDAYARSKKKFKRSGAGGKKPKLYIFNKQLHFLEKLYDPRETMNSVKTESDLADADYENSYENTSTSIPPSRKINKFEEVQLKIENNYEFVEEDEQEPHVTVNSGENISTSIPPSRKHKKLDEVDLKILKALEPPKPNTTMSFFEGILPHLEQFDNNDMLQFQMGVLQLISNINDRKTRISFPLPGFP